MSRMKLAHKLDLAPNRTKLKPRREPYWRTIDGNADDGFLSLGYRRSAKGAGTWIARHYNKPEGRRYGALAYADDNGQRANGRTVLTCAQATERAKAWLAGVRNPTPETATPEWTPEMEAIARRLAEGDAAEVAGKASVRWPNPNTVHRAAVEYIAALQVEKSRQQVSDTEWRLKRYILPSLGRRPIADLTKAELEKWRNSLVRTVDKAGAPVGDEKRRASMDTANRVLTMLKAALTRAYEDEGYNIPTDKAWRTLKPFKGVGRSRTLTLNADQRQRLINSTSGAFRKLIVATLYTGSRPAPGEVATCRVRDFHPDLGVISIPTGKTGRRDVPLTDAAVRWFTSITAGRDPDALLLPKDDGTAWGRNHPARPMRNARKRAQLPKETTLYTLRHTFATEHLMKGADLKSLADIMGTSVRMIEQHYGHIIAAHKRALVERAGDLVAVEPENVTTLPIAQAVDV